MLKSKDNMLKLAQAAREETARGYTFFEIGDAITQAAMKGTDQIYHKINLNSEQYSFDNACGIGEEIIRNLKRYNYLADYMVEESSKKLTLNIHIYWGTNPKEEYFPMIDNEEEE